MNVMDAMFTRRSVRSFSRQQVSEAQILTILDAAVQAPTAMNRQPWLFSVVQDRLKLKAYSERAKRQALAMLTQAPETRQYEALLQNESFDVFYDAGTLVVIGSATQAVFTDADCWLAAGNLMLAAHELGLGSCCIGLTLGLLNCSDVKAELGVPAEGVVVAAIVLGHPVALAPRMVREAPRIAAWLREPDRC